MRYDTTLKKIFLQPPNRLLSYVLGQPVTVVRTLPTDLITVENLHPDMLFEDVSGLLIHGEVHGYSMKEFACRNLIYYGLLLRDYKRHPVQIAFWVGRDRIGVTDGLTNPPHLQYSYRVVDVREIDAAVLLDGGGIGESIFSILCKLKDERESIVEILRRIGQLPPAGQKEAVAQLLILSGLRGLKEVVKEEVARMPLSMDIHDNEFLEEIYQDGMEKGLEKGLEKGRLAHARNSLLLLLEKKFGALSVGAKERIENAASQELDVWLLSVIDSDSLDKVFSSH